MRTVLAVAAVLAVTACGPDLTPEIRAIAPRVKDLAETKEANASFLKAVPRGADGVALAWTAAELEQQAAQAFPLRLEAASFHARLRGEIVVEALSGVKFEPGNRVDAIARVRGERLSYAGEVPSFLRAEVAQFIGAVEKGLNLALMMRLSLDGKSLQVKARATGATFAAAVDPGTSEQLVDAVNSHALQKPITFDLGADARLVPVSVLVTGRHLLLTWDPVGAARSGGPPAGGNFDLPPEPVALPPASPATPGSPHRPTRPPGR